MTDETNEIQSNASKGGTERARRLTRDQRAQIAREAASARWAKEGKEPVLQATHEGVVSFGPDLQIPCAVLEDGSRVLSETGMVNALGMYRSGAVLVRSQKSQSGNRLPLYVANKNVAFFVDDELEKKLISPKWFFPIGGGTKNRGVEADLIPQICEVWLKARDAGVLAGNARQELVAVKADILMRGLAKIGIVALVDEATGYQDVRARDALAKILEAFVNKELRKWVKTFPLDYFKEMCRLRGKPFTPSMKLPRYFGVLTNDVVYSRLAPGVLVELRFKNPTDDTGRRKHKNFQWLTENVGNPKLLQHLWAVVALMRVSTDWDGFKALLDKALPRYQPLPLLDGNEYDED